MSSAAVERNGRVTVVLPTCNRAALLPRAIETALGQTAAARCDIVVVDDGSTDATPAVAARYAGRVRYIRQRNAGLGAARNAAIRAQPNEFVALLDDDDLWLPDKLARQLAAAARWPAAVLIAGRTLNQYADGRREPRPIPPIPLAQPADLAPALFESNFLPPSSVLIRRQALLDVGLFHRRLLGVEDNHMWVRLACRGPMVFLDAPVAVYSVATPGALSNDRMAMLVRQLRARYLLQDQLRRRPDCRARWRRGLARCLTDLRDQAYREGRYDVAARYAVQTLAWHPWGRARWEWARLAAAVCRATLGPRAAAHRGARPARGWAAGGRSSHLAPPGVSGCSRAEDGRGSAAAAARA